MATLQPNSEWVLVWSDEFEGDCVDPLKWDFDLGNGFFDYKHNAWIPGWGNEELQYYTREPDNVSVRDSLLTIRAIKESLHGCGYTSARLKTRKRDGTPLFSKLYGKFEIRAKVPWGKGLWPALWLLPQADAYGGWAASGEIDVMEIVGEKPHEVLGTIHFGSTFPARSLVTHVHELPGGSTVADWHVYAVEWEPGEIRWRVDGILWATQNFWDRGQAQRRPEPLAGAVRPAFLSRHERCGRWQLSRSAQRADPLSGGTGCGLRAGL
jgi:beta-glucanase (GH16 family)